MLSCDCDLLAADPALLSEYNAVKLAGTADENTYEDRKSAFIDGLLGIWPTHPAGAGPVAPDRSRR